MKRDDLTGFGLSGNKVRKLEFHMAAAIDEGADTVITTGAAQSNHCRATSLAAARLGLECVLFLRTPDGAPPAESTGNHRLQLLGGAVPRYITPADYLQRDRLMAEEATRLADEGRNAWVIPEGASDALGMWGLVLGFEELNAQVASVDGLVAAVWHAASSAGTTAGLGWGADRTGSDLPLVAVSVGDKAVDLETHVDEIWTSACERYGGPMPEPSLSFVDEYMGEGYGIIDAAQPEIVEQATRLTGLLFDPTYTGKAIYGLRRAIEEGRFDAVSNVIFWHTGGGFAALA